MNINNKFEQEPDSNSAKENDSSLEELVRQEQSIARERLRKELGREPTQEEADRWLSAQTEGY
jgi:hypothetical protein